MPTDTEKKECRELIEKDLPALFEGSNGTSHRGSGYWSLVVESETTGYQLYAKSDPVTTTDWNNETLKEALLATADRGPDEQVIVAGVRYVITMNRPNERGGDSQLPRMVWWSFS